MYIISNTPPSLLRRSCSVGWIMHDVSISTVNYNYDVLSRSCSYHARCIHRRTLTTTTTKEGWWRWISSRCIHPTRLTTTPTFVVVVVNRAEMDTSYMISNTLHHPSFVVVVVNRAEMDTSYMISNTPPSLLRRSVRSCTCIHLSTVNYNYDEGGPSVGDQMDTRLSISCYDDGYRGVSYMISNTPPSLLRRSCS